MGADLDTRYDSTAAAKLAVDVDQDQKTNGLKHYESPGSRDDIIAREVSTFRRGWIAGYRFAKLLLKVQRT